MSPNSAQKKRNHSLAAMWQERNSGDAEGDVYRRKERKKSVGSPNSRTKSIRRYACNAAIKRPQNQIDFFSHRCGLPFWGSHSEARPPQPSHAGDGGVNSPTIPKITHVPHPRQEGTFCHSGGIMASAEKTAHQLSRTVPGIFSAHRAIAVPYSSDGNRFDFVAPQSSAVPRVVLRC